MEQTESHRDREPPAHAAARLAGSRSAAAAAQRTVPLAPPAPLLSSAHISSSRGGALSHDAAAAAPSPTSASARVPVPARTASPSAGSAAAASSAAAPAAPAAAPIKTEGQKADSAAAPISFAKASSIRPGQVVAAYAISSASSSNSRAQLYRVTRLWGRTLQAPAGSKSTFIPLGVDGKRAAKQSSLLLVTAVTTRVSDRSGIDFTLQPLPSREPAGADSFLDEDGLYRQASFSRNSQKTDKRSRRDGLPHVDISDPQDVCKSLRTCHLPNDHYRVHLHDGPKCAVAIPTIITLSPIESADFASWVDQAQTGGFFRKERDHEIRLAEACAQGFASNRPPKVNNKEEDQQEPVLHRDLLIAIDGLMVEIKQDSEMQQLFFPESADGGPSDGPMTLSRVQRNLSQGLYDHKLSLQYAVPWATFVAPVKRLLTDMAQVWIDFEAAGASKDDLKVCETVKLLWYSQIARAGGLLRHLDELFKSQQREDRRLRCLPGPTAAAAAAPASTSGASDQDDEAEDEPEPDSSAAAMDQSSDDDNEAAAAAPSSTGASAAAAAAAPVHPAMAAVQQLVNEADTLRRVNKELQHETALRRQEAQSTKAAAEAQQRESERLSRQVQSLQVAAAAQSAKLDQAQATIVELNKELDLRTSAEANLANSHSEMAAALSSNAALQLQVDTLQERLQEEADEAAKLREEVDEFRRISVVMANLATPKVAPKRAREPDDDDDQDEQQACSRPKHAPDSV